MSTYLYFPEWTEDHRTHAWFWLAQRRAKGKALPEVRASRHSTGRNTPQGALADLRAGDTLYIVLHGPPGCEYASTIYENGRQCRYSPLALALHLQREDLPQVPLRIKLWICGSGATWVSPQSGEVIQWPFAARLKYELVWLDYDAVSVIGYEAPILDTMIQPIANHTGRHKQAAWGTHEQPIGHTRASLTRVQF